MKQGSIILLAEKKIGHIHLFKSPKRLFGFKSLLLLTLASTGVLFLSPVNVHALTQRALQGIINNTYWYDPTVTNNTSGGCGNAVASLPAVIPEPYRAIFSQAAQKYGIDPNYLAALFLSEHNNNWPSPDGPWASSGAGATGPFQFLPSTWSAYQADGNGDGVMDINNLADASFGVANWISQSDVSKGLGDISKPFVPGTFLYFAASYNWGPGNVQEHTTPDSPLSVAPQETQNYVGNIYALISSGFTKGGPNFAPITGTGGSGSTSTSGSGALSCTTSNAAGLIVQYALNYAWPDRGHGPNQSDAKLEYVTAHDHFVPEAGGDYSGCDIFVATVMRASGVDPNYRALNVTYQLQYAEQHPEKYQIIGAFTNTTQVQPGDILINGDPYHGHTVIYTGPQPSGFNGADASNGDHVPQAQNVGDWNVGLYTVVRVKG
jgi:hypothetical protein